MIAVLTRAALVMAAAATLMACARTGDFGRRESDVMNDRVLPGVGIAAAYLRSEPVSIHPFTDAERTLRAKAYAFQTPPLDTQAIERLFAEGQATRILPNDWPHFSKASYAAHLLAMLVRSSTSRYARLIEDAEADRQRIVPFFSTARYVVELDGQREAALAFAPGVTPNERSLAMTRVVENRAIIGWVHRELGERVRAYRFALERLVMATPDPSAAAAASAIDALEQQIATIPVVTPHPENGRRGAPIGPAAPDPADPRIIKH